MTNEITILGVADATHYLVGECDNQGNFYAMETMRDVLVCQSLNDAKQLLKNHNIGQAQLQLETAYDEMCGLPTSKPTRETIYF